MDAEIAGEAAPVKGDRRRERMVLLVLAATQFTSIVDFMVVMPLGPQLMRTLGIDPAKFGMIVSSYTIAAGFAGLLASSLIDRFDRRTAFLVLYLGFLIGTLLCGMAPSYATLLAARVVTGSFGGVLGGMSMAIIGDVFPEERRGSATGSLMSAFALASVLGVPLGIEVGTRLGWHAPFLLLVGLGCPVMAFGMWALPPLRGHLGHAKARHPLVELRDTFTTSNHLRAFALIVTLMFGGFAVIPYISPYLVSNVGITENDLKYFYASGGLLTLICSPFIGKLADRFGKLTVYRVIAPISAFMMLAITSLPRVGLLVAVLAGGGLMVCNAGRMIAAMAMVTSSVEPRKRGGFMSANSAVQHLATGVGAAVGGLMIVKAPDGTLLHFERVGLIAMAATLVSVWLAGRLRIYNPAEKTTVDISLGAAAEGNCDASEPIAAAESF